MIATTTSPLGFTTQLHDHIVYPTEGVFRKILAKDEKRQAVLVCLKAGTDLKSHVSSHAGFMTILEGQGILTMESQEIELKPGIFIAMPENITHAIQAIADLAFLKIVDRHEGCQEHSQ